MPVSPDYMAYGDTPEDHEPYNRELVDDLERRAADLWRKENPDASVFSCDAATKTRYRARVLAEDE
jgi:hypothetical protein